MLNEEKERIEFLFAMPVAIGTWDYDFMTRSSIHRDFKPLRRFSFCLSLNIVNIFNIFTNIKLFWITAFYDLNSLENHKFFSKLNVVVVKNSFSTTKTASFRIINGGECSENYTTPKVIFNALSKLLFCVRRN